MTYTLIKKPFNEGEFTFEAENDREALNMIKWYARYHGMTPDCFDFAKGKVTHYLKDHTEWVTE